MSGNGDFQRYGYKRVRDNGGLGPPERAWAYVFEKHSQVLAPPNPVNPLRHMARRILVRYDNAWRPNATEVTWIVPPRVKTIWVTGSGGGGGGSGSMERPTFLQSGAGGGASAYTVKCPVHTEEGQVIRVAVGGGASGGLSETDGEDGGESVIHRDGDVVMRIAGGAGAQAATGILDVAIGGAGGKGLITYQSGSAGAAGQTTAGSGGVPVAGSGGNGAFGRGASQGNQDAGDGAGGKGGTPGERNGRGSDGGNGFVILEW